MSIARKVIELLENPPPIVAAGGKPVPAPAFRGEAAAFEAYLTDCRPRSVGLLLDHDYRYMIAVLVCLKLRIPFVTLRKSWPASRIDQVRGIAGLDRVIDESAFRQDLPVAHPPSPFLIHSEVAYVMFTSGSTGEPKGAEITRPALDNYLAWVDRFFGGVTAADNILFATHFTFDPFFTDLSLALHKRAQCTFSKFTTNSDFFTLGHEIGKHRVSVLNTIPNNMLMLTAEGLVDRIDLSGLRHVILGGSRLPVTTYEKMLRHLPQSAFYNFYGTTETTVYSHAIRYANDAAKDFHEGMYACVGTPITGAKCEVVGADGNPVSEPGATGEICIGPDAILGRFVNKGLDTSGMYTQIAGERYYLTGDLGFKDSEGRFFINGRRDDTIKRRGFRVNLLDIDTYIKRLAGVQDAHSIAIENENFDFRIVTFVIKGQGFAGEAAFRDAMKDVLVGYQIPDEIRFVDVFPTNNSGKVSKKDLLAAYRKSA